MKKAVMCAALAMMALGVCAAQTLAGAWTDLAGNLWIFGADGRLIIDNFDTVHTVDGRLIIKDFDTTYTVDGRTMQLQGELYDDGADFPLDYPMTFDIAFSDNGKTAVLKGSYTSERYFPRLHNPLLQQQAEADKALNGTWIDEFEEDGIKYRFEITYNNGVYEVSSAEEPVARGFYVTNNGKVTIIITDFFNAADSQWEREPLFSVTRDYSIRGRTLTVGSETVQTKKSWREEMERKWKQ